MRRDKLHDVYNSSMPMHKSILSEQGSNCNLLITETSALCTITILLICAKWKLFSEIDDASQAQYVTS